MKVKFIVIIAIVFLIVSCWNKPRNTNGSAVHSGEMPETIDVATEPLEETNSDVSYKPPQKIIINEAYGFDGFFKTTHNAVINADCDYFDTYGNHLGRLQKRQEIIFIGSYFFLSDFGVTTEIAMVINGNQVGTAILVAEKYITLHDGERFNSWFKNKQMTREYYYTGTVEEIFKNDIGRDIERNIINIWQNFYYEQRLYFSDNYLVMGDNTDARVFRIDSVLFVSSTNDNNIYILLLFDGRGELEVTLIDDGGGITITQCTAKSEALFENFIKLALNFRYVPYDSVRSKRTEDAVNAWCDRQIEILSGR